jgi:hypothetical protein
MLVAAFGDAHAHAEALEAVIAAAEAAGADELWSLGDMVGGGPDPERAVALTRERCRVALLGNHDYGATGSVEPERLGGPGSLGARSVELARERLSEEAIAWMRARKPAARREGVQCWHGSPRNPVWEFVGRGNVAACLAAQRAPIGLVAHTHVAGAWCATPDGRAQPAKIEPGVPLELAGAKWMLNPGAVGAPAPSPQRVGWWDGLDAQAADGAFWLLLDLDPDRPTATWRRAPYDPAPARARARALGLDVTSAAR